LLSNLGYKRKVIGVIFEIKGSKYSFGKDEWSSNIRYDLSNISKMLAVMVEGNSIDPIARNGQFVLINDPIPIERTKDGMLAIIETADYSRIIKRINRNKKNDSIILTSANIIDPHKPLSIDINNILKIYPLAGVLFEAN